MVAEGDQEKAGSAEDESKDGNHWAKDREILFSGKSKVCDGGHYSCSKQKSL